MIDQKRKNNYLMKFIETFKILFHKFSSLLMSHCFSHKIRDIVYLLSQFSERKAQIFNHEIFIENMKLFMNQSFVYILVLRVTKSYGTINGNQMRFWKPVMFAFAA